MKSYLITALLLCLSHSVLASQPRTGEPVNGQTCADKFEVFDNTQVQTMESSGLCYVSVHPRNIDHLVYRDFLFDSAGLLMIFDSYGEGSESQTTAARNYQFFPRKQNLSYSYDAASKVLKVSSPSGKMISFNTVKAIMTDISGAAVTWNYEVNPIHRGGIEITANDGLYLDGGFKRGQSPSQNPKDPVAFKDSAAHTCGLVNNDIYRYTSDQDAIFKFDDKQLKSYLSSQCPQLQF